MSESNLVQYGSYEVEAADSEQEALDQSSASDFMKLEVGNNIVRILPPPVGVKSPFVMVHQHFIQLPGMDHPASFACPRMMAKKPCPVCQKVTQLRATGNPADYDMAGEFLARLRVFVNVIDRKNEAYGPRTLGFGKTIHEPLIELRRNEDAGGDYTHPIKGFDINIKRKGTGKNDTEYSVHASRKSGPLSDDPDQMQDWLTSQPDNSKYARILEWDAIMKMIGGGGTGRSAQTAPTRGAGRPAAKPKARTAEADAFREPGDDEDEDPVGF